MFFSKQTNGSLALQALIKISLGVTAVIVTSTAISYYYIHSILAFQVREKLAKYVIERGEREEGLFTLAEDNLALLKQETLRQPSSTNDAIKIQIQDNAMGMSEEVKVKIFDRLFTTKSVGKGTGLGLAIAYQIIVEKHKGKLEVHSELGKGTEFIIFIPTKPGFLTS